MPVHMSTLCRNTHMHLCMCTDRHDRRGGPGVCRDFPFSYFCIPLYTHFHPSVRYAGTGLAFFFRLTCEPLAHVHRYVYTDVHTNFRTHVCAHVHTHVYYMCLQTPSNLSDEQDKKNGCLLVCAHSYTHSARTHLYACPHTCVCPCTYRSIPMCIRIFSVYAEHKHPHGVLLRKPAHVSVHMPLQLSTHVPKRVYAFVRVHRQGGSWKCRIYFLFIFLYTSPLYTHFHPNVRCAGRMCPSRCAISHFRITLLACLEHKYPHRPSRHRCRGSRE